jgi:transposase-like protein
MDDTINEIRERLLRFSRESPMAPYPSQVRSLVVSYAQREIGDGVNFKQISRLVGIPANTIRYWWTQAQIQLERRSQATRKKDVLPTPAPVRIKQEENADTSVSTAVAGRLILVTPGGYRLEGLALEEALVVLERLS